MPDTGTQTYRIIIAETDHGHQIHGEGVVDAEIRGAVPHGHDDHHDNPLAHHTPWYFSGVALLVALMLVTTVLYCTRNMQRIPRGKRQSLAEVAVEGMTNFTKAALGPGGERFTPLVGGVFFFILFSNLMGVLPSVFGVTARDATTGEVSSVAHILPAPTANLSMTIALALVVFVVVQAAGIRANGLGGHLKHLAGPIPALAPLLFPLEVIGEFAKPLSLSIRLFGNIFGEETVIAVLVTLAATTLPWVLPIPYQLPMLLFGIFGGLVQAAVFTILTCAYISLAVGEHSEHAEHHDEEHPEQHFGREVVVP